MQFPWKLKNNAFAGLITNLPLGSLMKINNAVHQQAQTLLNSLDLISCGTKDLLRWLMSKIMNLIRAESFFFCSIKCGCTLS